MRALYLAILLICFKSIGQIKLESNIYFLGVDDSRNPILSSDGSRLFFHQKGGDEEGLVSMLTNNLNIAPQLLTSINAYGRQSSSRFHLLGFDGKKLYFSNRFSVNEKVVNQLYSSEFDGVGFQIPKPISIEDMTALKGMDLVSDLNNPSKIYVKKSTDSSPKVYEVIISGNRGYVINELPSELVRDGIENLTVIGENAILFRYSDKESDHSSGLYLSIKEKNVWSIPLLIKFQIKLNTKAKWVAKILSSERVKDPETGKYIAILDSDSEISYSEVDSCILFSCRGGVYSAKFPERISSKISYDYPDLSSSFETGEATMSEDEKLSSKNIQSRYFALLIGIDDYKYDQPNLIDLDNPISDSKKLRSALLDHYSFEESNITSLENPTREDLIDAFENLSKKISERDNLLIFYAGHGYWDSKLNIGYWLTSDATHNSKVNWISNSTIRDYIAGLQSKHTLLISDACFSGSIFKTREVGNSLDDMGFYRLNKLPSRKAMTSGTLKSVPDKSQFMKYFLKALESNTSKYMTAMQLFHEIEISVINNSSNTPQFGTIQNTGDEGGDFIFIKNPKK